jgi:hypothetical protein
MGSLLNCDVTTDLGLDSHFLSLQNTDTFDETIGSIGVQNFFMGCWNVPGLSPWAETGLS